MSSKYKLASTIVCILVLFVWSSGGYFQKQTKQHDDSDRRCFCELEGSIDDCSCTVDTVDHFNNVKIFPILQSLLVKDYFRYFKVNLHNDCPFWADDSKCAMKFCHVEACDDNDIPSGLKGSAPFHGAMERAAQKYSESENTANPEDCKDDHNMELSYLNTSLSVKAQEDFQLWSDYDEAQDNFCILDDNQEGAEYVDLLLNPERYTGYKGESAHRIWRSIYLENCFLSDKIPNGANGFKFVSYSDHSDMCMEQRTFYRLISGLHASINVHLSANFLLSEKKGFVSPRGVWGPNLEEFIRRFSPDHTSMEGPNWLRNLYFTYIIEMRALAKASSYLRGEIFFTGNRIEDVEVKQGVNEFLTLIEQFPSHFNESQMFLGGPASLKMKTEFREKFRNISMIMDCVGCDKCKLWGKLQTQGLGTALKILFSGKFDTEIEYNEDNVPVELNGDNQLKLRRIEIVSLFNAFGRLSNSIRILEDFREKLS